MVQTLNLISSYLQMVRTLAAVLWFVSIFLWYQGTIVLGHNSPKEARGFMRYLQQVTFRCFPLLSFVTRRIRYGNNRLERCYPPRGSGRGGCPPVPLPRLFDQSCCTRSCMHTPRNECIVARLNVMITAIDLSRTTGTVPRP